MNEPNAYPAMRDITPIWVECYLNTLFGDSLKHPLLGPQGLSKGLQDETRLCSQSVAACAEQFLEALVMNFAWWS